MISYGDYFCDFSEEIKQYRDSKNMKRQRFSGLRKWRVVGEKQSNTKNEKVGCVGAISWRTTGSITCSSYPLSGVLSPRVLFVDRVPHSAFLTEHVVLPATWVGGVNPLKKTSDQTALKMQAGDKKKCHRCRNECGTDVMKVSSHIRCPCSGNYCASHIQVQPNFRRQIY